MIRPLELSLGLTMQAANKVLSTTDKVWDILSASRNGDLQQVKALTRECPELIYAQYNYTPPIHFAVREGHTELVNFLLDQGAHDPKYRIYPFLDTLDILAEDRGYTEIVTLLKDYAAHPERQKYFGDNGKILFNRTPLQIEFEKAVDREDLEHTARILKDHPEFAADETYFWGEGILTFAAKLNNRAMVDLLMSYGAKVPDILKWTQKYYFERLDGATYMMEKGMNPNTKSWHNVIILHDMAQKGDLAKAELLLKYGADLNAVEEEYQSTPLGMAARWGHLDMVGYLLEHGADPKHAGADWATPLAWAESKGHTEIEDLLKLNQ
ncbi:MAG: ankyrin repeat domain-containing protein [Bacteroidota bacterium]